MGSAAAVDGIIDYLNLREFEHALAAADLHAERPLYRLDQHIHADYGGLRLSSLFQPIVRNPLAQSDAAKPTIVAHEALLAAHTASGAAPLGQALAPRPIFARSHSDAEIVALDRLARTLHALNFLAQADGGDLHLNVDSHHLVAVATDHGRVFEQILGQCGLAPAHIVLEVSEYDIRDRTLLRAALFSWQARAYLIAIDNFGRGHLQLQRVIELRPDYVKFDRRLLHAATLNRQDRALLERHLDALRGNGIRSIATGVETPAHYALANELGFDNAQGFLLGRPAVRCLSIEHEGEQRKCG